MSGDQTSTATTSQQEARRGRLLSVFLSPTFTLALTFTVTVSMAVAIYSAVTLILQDNGWDVLSAEVSTERRVVIDQDLEVTRDLKLAGSGSVIDMTGVDCTSEDRSDPGSGRLCFDGEAREFQASVSGGDYAGFAGAPGAPGDSCWDLDGDHQADAGEDTNGDGVVDAADCRPDAAPVMAGRLSLRRTPLDDVPKAIQKLIFLPTNDDVVRPLRSWAQIPLDGVFTEAADAGILNVQVTPVNQFLQLFVYIDVEDGFVYILDDGVATGQFHYLIQPAPPTDLR